MSKQFTFLILIVFALSIGIAYALYLKKETSSPAVKESIFEIGTEAQVPTKNPAPSPVVEKPIPPITPPTKPKPDSAMVTPTPEPTSQVPKTHRITIKNYEFVPAAVTITAGDTVIWTNEDQASHTIEANDASFESALIRTGQSYSHTFASAGLASYFCGPHPYMKASISVGAR